MGRNPGAFDCGKCGCDPDNGFDAGFAKWAIPGVMEFRKCPKQNLTEYALYALYLYRFFASGHLFLAGGLMDQPAAYLAAMDSVQSAVMSLDDN